MLTKGCNPIYTSLVFLMGGVVGLLTCGADMTHHSSTLVIATGVFYLTLVTSKKTSQKTSNKGS